MPQQVDRLRRAVAAGIRLARSERGLSQEALARAVGCSTTQIRAVERLRANPSLALIGRLAVALGVSDIEIVRRGVEAELAAAEAGVGEGL